MTRRSRSSAAEMRDAEIFAAAHRALDAHPNVAPDVHVHVEHGYVTLTGQVQWPAEREEAERLVRPLPGVIGVINSIVVAHQPSALGFEPPDKP
jgi:osmotically-inducible protein OsmY